jgi:hypothetical protein
MSFDAGTILAGLLVSSIGFVLLSYGKKQSRPPHMLTGLILMIYPYFVPGVLATLAIGIVILGLFWLALKQGL